MRSTAVTLMKVKHTEDALPRLQTEVGVIPSGSVLGGFPGVCYRVSGLRSVGISFETHSSLTI